MVNLLQQTWANAPVNDGRLRLHVHENKHLPHDSAYLSLSSLLSDERRSLRRYLGPRESNSFATLVITTGLGLFLT